MEKLLNLLFAVVCWYENTTVRRSDPDEMKDFKRCERGTAVYIVLTGVFSMLYLWLANQLPFQGGPVIQALTPLFMYITYGAAWLAVGSALTAFYYLGKSIYTYISLQ